MLDINLLNQKLHHYVHIFLLSEKNYTSLEEVYTALMNREVKGTLIESNIAASRSDLFNHPDLTVVQLIEYPLSYGYVTAGEARNVRDYIAEEVERRETEIIETMTNLTGFIEVGTKASEVSFYAFVRI